LVGKDVSLCAETGSGKTLAYLLPLMNRILKIKQQESSSVDLLNRSAPPVVVLCPSADLCKQVLDVARQLDRQDLVIKQWLGSSSSENSTLGGSRIRWGVSDLIVSTPAKFREDLDRFREDQLKPSTIVFDEADFLFQTASKDSVVDILSYIRPRPRTGQSWLVQCVISSATIPDLSSVSSALVHKFITAEIIRTNEFHSLPSSIETIDFIPELEANWELRCYMLTQTLGPLVEQEKRILVFVNSQRNASILHAFLKEKKWPVGLFKKGSEGPEDFQIIVTTDAGGRGIDWNGGVDVVINFQMPTDVVSWLHRAGRTGRLGKPGQVISFYKQKEQQLVDILKSKVENGQPVDSLFSRKRSLRRKLRNS
jgi:superfamily II DNA/RNA helicase